jgi:hypothetical protein
MSSYEYMIGLLYEDKLLRERYGDTQMSPERRNHKLALRLSKSAIR